MDWVAELVRASPDGLTTAEVAEQMGASPPEAARTLAGLAGSHGLELRDGRWYATGTRVAGSTTANDHRAPRDHRTSMRPPAHPTQSETIDGPEPLPVKGWYPDPLRADGYRWWDGRQWLDGTHPQGGARLPADARPVVPLAYRRPLNSDLIVLVSIIMSILSVVAVAWRGIESPLAFLLDASVAAALWVAIVHGVGFGLRYLMLRPGTVPNLPPPASRDRVQDPAMG